MEFIELIAMALEQGCGVLIEQAVRDSLAEVRERFEYWQGLDPQSDEAVALRAGHIEMGELFNNLPEAEALRQAQPMDSQLDPGDVVLLEETGKRLIEAAAGCLPVEVRAIAKSWPTLAEEDQQRALQDVYKILRQKWKCSKQIETNERVAGGPSWVTHTSEDHKITYSVADVERAIEDLRRRDMNDAADLAQLALDYARTMKIDLSESDEGLPDGVQEGNSIIVNYALDAVGLKSSYGWFDGISGENDYSVDGVLPLRYGVLGETASTPSCLGMSIMLSAFAKLAGAPVMLAAQLEWEVESIIEMKLSAVEKVYELFVECGVTSGDRFEWLEGELCFLRGVSRRVQDTHYGIVIQLRSGAWWHLDPYQLSVQPLGANWGIEAHYQMLGKYRKVLPGLCLIADDDGELARWCTDWVDSVTSTFATTRSLMQAALELPIEQTVLDRYDQDGEEGSIPTEDSDWLADLLDNAAGLDDYYEELMQLVRQSRSQEEVFDAVKEIDERYVRYRLTLVGFNISDWSDKPQEVEQDALEAYFDLFAFDEEWRAEQIASTLMSWLWRRLRLLRVMVADRFHAKPAPALELSSPEYSVALAAVSHLRSWTDTDLSGRLLLEYSSSQVYWHEAVDFSGGYESSEAEDPVVLRAETMVRSLTHIHRACARKLDYLARQRAERGQSGQEENPRGSGGGDPQAAG